MTFHINGMKQMQYKTAQYFLITDNTYIPLIYKTLLYSEGAKWGYDVSFKYDFDRSILSQSANSTTDSKYRYLEKY